MTPMTPTIFCEASRNGAATAVATGASAIKDAATGKPARFRWVVVYFKGDPDWQVALSQASRVPARR